MSLENFLDVGRWCRNLVRIVRVVSAFAYTHFSASPITQLGHTTIEEFHGEFFRRSICETQFLPAELRAQMYNNRLPKRSSYGLGLCMVVHHRQHGYAWVSWIFNAGASRRLRLIMLYPHFASSCNVSFLKYGQLFGKESWWNLCRNKNMLRRNCDNCHVRSQS